MITKKTETRRRRKQLFVDRMGGKCEICGYNKYVEISHKKQVFEFSDNITLEEINDINNLIALCPNHHWELDHNVLKF